MFRVGDIGAWVLEPVVGYTRDTDYKSRDTFSVTKNSAIFKITNYRKGVIEHGIQCNSSHESYGSNKY